MSQALSWNRPVESGQLCCDTVLSQELNQYQSSGFVQRTLARHAKHRRPFAPLRYQLVQGQNRELGDLPGRCRLDGGDRLRILGRGLPCFLVRLVIKIIHKFAD